jgi:hypothetical protein
MPHLLPRSLPFSSAIALVFAGLIPAQEPAANSAARRLPSAMPSLLRFHHGDELPDLLAVRPAGGEWRLSQQQGKLTIVGLVAIDPTTAAPATFRSGSPGWASNMPMSAQKTMSCTTRGLVRA